MSNITEDNPSKIPAENNNLKLWVINDGVELDRETSNQRYAQRAIDLENEANRKRKIGTFREFMGFFTTDQQVAIKKASLDPNNALLGLWYDQAVASNNIDLNDPLVADGLDALVAAGLIDAAGKAAIIDGDYDSLGA